MASKSRLNHGRFGRYYAPVEEEAMKNVTAGSILQRIYPSPTLHTVRDRVACERSRASSVRFRNVKGEKTAKEGFPFESTFGTDCERNTEKWGGPG